MLERDSLGLVSGSGGKCRFRFGVAPKWLGEGSAQGRGFALKVEDTRWLRGGRRAVVAALASVLLASCATSETDVPMGFAGIAPASHTTASDGLGSGSAIIADAGLTQTDSVEGSVPEAADIATPDAVAMAGENPEIVPVEAEQQQAALALQPEGEQALVAEAEAASAEQVAALAQPVEPEIAAAPVEEQGSAEPETAEAQPTQFLDNATPAQEAALAPAPQPKKRGLLAFFSGGNQQQAPQQSARNRQVNAAPVRSSAASATPSPTITASTAAQPIIQLAATGQAAQPLIARAPEGSSDALPGVRQNALFEITRRSGLDDDSDIDLHEDGLYQVASVAPGMARLAPNGLLKQRENVDVACLKPSLVRVLKSVERHFGRKLVVTSGYRSPDYNRKVRGARNSLHMYCAAADVQVEGISKWDLAKYVRSMPGRGGVGTYCHTESVHIDVGPERDWNWRCRRRK